MLSKSKAIMPKSTCKALVFIVRVNASVKAIDVPPFLIGELMKRTFKIFFYLER
jgi:hypothetical protein